MVFETIAYTSSATPARTEVYRAQALGPMNASSVATLARLAIETVLGFDMRCRPGLRRRLP
jgi:hypothetical protein